MLKEYINQYNKVIVWGCSGAYKLLKESIGINLNIDYFIDANEKLNEFEGKQVFRKEILSEEKENILIVICSMYFEEIKKEILKINSKFDFIYYEDFANIVGENQNENFDFNKESILTISRNDFRKYLGGTSKFIGEQSAILQSNKYNTIHIYWRECRINGKKDYIINLIQNSKYKISIRSKEIKKLQYNTIIIHNLINLDLEFMKEYLNTEDKKILYYLHDFSSMCSSIKLIHSNTNMHCEFYSKGNMICLNCNNRIRQKEIFDFHYKLFRNKNCTLIAPSNNTKKFYKDIFDLNEEKFKVYGHDKIIVKKEEYIKEKKREKLRIGYVGYKNKFKGWEEFKEISNIFSEKYEFFMLGECDEYLENVKKVNVSFIKDGKLAMVNKLIENKIDIAFLWSVWPETYSYTYYESFQAETFIVTNIKSGNIKDQVLKNENGIVLKDIEELKDILRDEKKIKKLSCKRKKCYNLGMNHSFINHIPN